MIELVDFSKSYEKNLFAVKNVNLKAENGQITGLLGLNGTGKTTIIKAITGNHFATSGKILITEKNGFKFNIEENIEKAKKIIGYVPEQIFFPNRLKVEEYISLVKMQFSVSDEDLEKTINLCGLSEVLSKKIGTLSKGYRQRLGFAQALIHNPENIVLDEPVNGLDPAQIIQMRKLIKKIAETKTVIISTHLMQEVEALCTKIYILNNGSIAIAGTEQEILLKTGTKNIENAFLKATGKESDEKLS
ncbi:MAG: ABC transporter ATP-binding protein [Treponema sp.]|jgi:ABC-2 type transport system ATP-binding protein|nr:ABC transporter ATP-binding protein [Treponema sp.]